MLQTRILLAAVAAVALLAPGNVSLAQYRGPPIIVQTPQPAPTTDNLKPLTSPTLPAPSAAPTAAPPAAAAAPAAAAPAQPCAANTKC